MHYSRGYNGANTGMSSRQPERNTTTTNNPGQAQSVNRQSTGPRTQIREVYG